MCHLVELLSCSLIEVHPSSFTQLASHNSHNSSNTTPLFSQVTELVSHHSTHLTTHRSPFTSLRSSYNCHNSSHITSHTTHLTQLISHNSSYTTQPTQELLLCAFWWNSFRVLSRKFTRVLSHNSHLTTPTTDLTQFHSSHISSHISSHNLSHTNQLTQELLFAWHLVALTELYRKSFTYLISCSVTYGVIRFFLCEVMKLPFHLRSTMAPKRRFAGVKRPAARACVCIGT